MGDRVSRGAARWATLVAVPLALAAGVASFAVLGGFDDRSGGPGATPASSAAHSASTGAVTVPARTLPARAQVVCRALLSRLPDNLRDRDRDRRPVTTGAEQNAAYGDPPIIVSCGATAATFPATDLVYALDQVCWHAAQASEGTVWTTVDREVPIQVTVPGAYREPGQWVIEFSGPVIATVPSITEVPAGCNP